MQREWLGFNARTDSMGEFLHDRDRWLRTYNLHRPHEALDDHAPISRYRRSHRPRPDIIPPVAYPDNAVLRKVSQVGDIHYHRVRIGLSRALAGQFVRVEERENEIAVYYAWKPLRVIQHAQLINRGRNERI